MCAILVATASAAALRSLALAADGSYYLVRILGTPGVFGPESRTLVNAVRQAPLLLAGWLGVDATSSLAVVQGLGQLVLPALVWCLAVVVARHEALVFVAVSTTGALCLGATLFFNVSESLLAVALTASVAVLLWQPRVWRGTDMALAVAASSVLVASYESTALTGVLLAGWAAWRALSASGAERYAAALVAALSALSVAVAYSGTATETGSISARSSLYSIVSFEPAEFYVALLAVATLVGVWYVPLGRRTRAGIALAAGALACLTVSQLPATPLSSFQARGGAACAGLALTLFLGILWANHRRQGTRSSTPSAGRWVVVVPVVLAVAMAASTSAGLDRWSRDLEAFRTEVDRARGIADVDDVLASDRRTAVWGWTSPSLSLIVRRNARSGILVESDPSIVPFAPVAALDQLSGRYAWH